MEEQIFVKEIVRDVNYKIIRNGNTVLCRVESNGEENLLYLNEECLNIDDQEAHSHNSETQVLSEEMEQSSQNLHWGDGDTRLLLDLYAKYLPEVGPLKAFKNKRQMWKQISEEIFKESSITRTPVQCESRYKTILKRKNTSVKINQTSGQTRAEVQFEEQIEKIKSIDDSLEPEILMSATQIKINNKRPLSPSTSKNTKKMKPSLARILKEIHTEKEANKERRHKEKLDLMKKIFENKD